MNSLKDEDLKQIKEICNDDLKQNDIEIINYICFEDQFDFVKKVLKVYIMFSTKKQDCHYQYQYIKYRD